MEDSPQVDGSKIRRRPRLSMASTLSRMIIDLYGS
jgi:hypothetical protein